jgi:ribonuclease HII
MPDYALESEAGGLVAGLDEVGRGPLAGPVLAAAALFLAPPAPDLAGLLDDSKKLSAARRDQAFAALLEARARGELAFAIAAASSAEIGRLNILRASHLAMCRALARLPVAPDLALVDGHLPPPLPCAVRCVVGGDGVSLSIAAASILAKVVRDRAMARLDARHPGWGFARNQGYPTAAHRLRLAEVGPTRHHRRGFAPVDQASLLLVAPLG